MLMLRSIGCHFVAKYTQFARAISETWVAFETPGVEPAFAVRDAKPKASTMRASEMHLRTARTQFLAALKGILIRND